MTAAITVHSVVAPSGELRGKGRYGVLCSVTAVRSMPERFKSEASHLRRYTMSCYLTYEYQVTTAAAATTTTTTTTTTIVTNY